MTDSYAALPVCYAQGCNGRAQGRNYPHAATLYDCWQWTGTATTV